MSVLIPGQTPLLHRACIEHQKWYLLEWFSTVECRAWDVVNATYPTNRPEKLFLVTGQTLTSEYAISYQEQQCSRCEVSVEGKAGIPSMVDSRVFYGHGCQRVVASFGFEVVAQNSGADDTASYSVYLEKFESSPMKRFQKEGLLVRSLAKLYRYISKT
jgi:hypothetical protein